MADVDRKQPAIIGGVIVGVLSVIPIMGNTCCCLWALVGGIVAAKLLIDRSPQAVKASDGAMTGLLAGLIGSAIYLVVGIPISALTRDLILRLYGRFITGFGNPQAEEIMQRMIEQTQRQSFAQRLASSILLAVFVAILLTVYTTLGGLLGIALFEKRKDQPPPPPPPSYPPYPPTYTPTPPPPPPSTPPSGGYGGESGGGTGGEPPVGV